MCYLTVIPEITLCLVKSTINKGLGPAKEINLGIPKSERPQQSWGSRSSKQPTDLCVLINFVPIP